MRLRPRIDRLALFVPYLSVFIALPRAISAGAASARSGYSVMWLVAPRSQPEYVVSSALTARSAPMTTTGLDSTRLPPPRLIV